MCIVLPTFSLSVVSTLPPQQLNLKVGGEERKNSPCLPSPSSCDKHRLLYILQTRRCLGESPRIFCFIVANVCSKETKDTMLTKTSFSFFSERSELTSLGKRITEKRRRGRSNPTRTKEEKCLLYTWYVAPDTIHSSCCLLSSRKILLLKFLQGYFKWKRKKKHRMNRNKHLLHWAIWTGIQDPRYASLENAN